MTLYERLGIPDSRDAFDYWAAVYQKAWELGSDGCSAVGEYLREACVEHDIHYRTGMTVYGVPLSRRDADTIFRWRMQALSPLRVFSPMAWWRWMAVRALGDSSWQGEREEYDATPPSR